MGPWLMGVADLGLGWGQAWCAAGRLWRPAAHQAGEGGGAPMAPLGFIHPYLGFSGPGWGSLVCSRPPLAACCTPGGGIGAGGAYGALGFIK